MILDFIIIRKKVTDIVEVVVFIKNFFIVDVKTKKV